MSAGTSDKTEGLDWDIKSFRDHKVHFDAESQQMSNGPGSTSCEVCAAVMLLRRRPPWWYGDTRAACLFSLPTPAAHPKHLGLRDRKSGPWTLILLGFLRGIDHMGWKMLLSILVSFFFLFIFFLKQWRCQGRWVRPAVTISGRPQREMWRFTESVALWGCVELGHAGQSGWLWREEEGSSSLFKKKKSKFRGYACVL